MAVLNCVSSTVSNCNHIAAGVTCIYVIYQGATQEIEIQLTNNDSTKLDLDTITDIYLIMYDDANTVIHKFKYPTETPVDTINILQNVYNDVILDKGLISIELTETMTGNMISGGLYVEMKLTDTNEKKYVIGCLKVGKVKRSVINKYDYEQDNPDIDIESIL